MVSSKKCELILGVLIHYQPTQPLPVGKVTDHNHNTFTKDYRGSRCELGLSAFSVLSFSPHHIH